MKVHLYIYYIDDKTFSKYILDATETKKSINITMSTDNSKKRMPKNEFNTVIKTINSLKVYQIDNHFENESEMDEATRNLIKKELQNETERVQKQYLKKLKELESALMDIDTSDLVKKEII